MWTQQKHYFIIRASQDNISCISPFNLRKWLNEDNPDSSCEFHMEDHLKPFHHLSSRTTNTQVQTNVINKWTSVREYARDVHLSQEWNNNNKVICLRWRVTSHHTLMRSHHWQNGSFFKHLIPDRLPKHELKCAESDRNEYYCSVSLSLSQWTWSLRFYLWCHFLF